MGRVDTSKILRDEVVEIIEDAKVKKKGKETHVRDQLAKRYPGIEDTMIVRNGRQYNSLDYLVGDLGSYG